MTADEALARLIEGNERFVRGEARFPTVQKEILADLAKGQQPYATILGCSDSRVPPELVFDAGFGELFIVRVAGNVISAEIMGTLQYAGMHLHTPLFVVMGHRGCGAVSAPHLQRRSTAPRILIELRCCSRAFTRRSRTSTARCRRESCSTPPSKPTCAGRCARCCETPEARQRAAKGVMKLVGAVYDLETGRVRFLS